MPFSNESDWESADWPKVDVADCVVFNDVHGYQCKHVMTVFGKEIVCEPHVMMPESHTDSYIIYKKIGDTVKRYLSKIRGPVKTKIGNATTAFCATDTDGKPLKLRLVDHDLSADRISGGKIN